jgi:hypothetical protein
MYRHSHPWQLVLAKLTGPGCFIVLNYNFYNIIKIQKITLKNIVLAAAFFFTRLAGL